MFRTLFEGLEAGVLLTAAGFALIAWTRIRSAGPTAPFWLVAACGTLLLAINELLDGHERLARALYERGFHEPPRVNHLDDLLLMAAGLAGLLTIGWGLPGLWRDQRVFRPFVCGLVVFAGAILWDAFASTKGSASWWFEESLELLGGIAVAVAFARKAQTRPAPKSGEFGPSRAGAGIRPRLTLR